MYIKGRGLTLANERGDAQSSQCDVVVMYGDLRRFSTWSNLQRGQAVADAIQEQQERVLQIINDHHPSFYKFLGDGFLLLWEADEELPVHASLRHAIDAAYHTHNRYHHAQSARPLPPGYGIGVSVGAAVKVQPQTIVTEFNEIDFVGYPLNCGARMQTLARPFGVAICSATAAIIAQNPNDFLYPHDPHVSRALRLPTAAALAEANRLRGLLPADQTDFRYLTWPSHNPRWGSDGIP